MGTAVHLIINSIPKSVWHGIIDKTPKSIGRNSDSRIQIPPEHLSVSRHHAEVWSTNQTAYIRDVDSRLGTSINGVKLVPLRDYEISIGDRISLGELELEVVCATENDGNVRGDREPGGSGGPSAAIKRGRQGGTDEINV